MFDIHNHNALIFFLQFFIVTVNFEYARGNRKRDFIDSIRKYFIVLTRLIVWVQVIKATLY